MTCRPASSAPPVPVSRDEYVYVTNAARVECHKGVMVFRAKWEQNKAELVDWRRRTAGSLQVRSIMLVYACRSALDVVIKDGGSRRENFLC